MKNIDLPGMYYTYGRLKIMKYIEILEETKKARKRRKVKGCKNTQ